MAILYNKHEPGTAFSSIEEASNQDYLKNIRLRMPDTGTTRCLGSALDACPFDYRTALGKSVNKHGSIRYNGENDDVIDAWNMLDVIRNSEDLVLLYDRERDGDLDQEILNTLPENVMIGTGRANGKYIDENNPDRSRHAIVTIGNLVDGTPIIYDLGKIYKGIPDKYRNQINYIAMPRNQFENYIRPTVQPQRQASTTVQAEPEPVYNTPDFNTLFERIGPADNLEFLTNLLSLRV